jgi:hypothetical protein
VSLVEIYRRRIVVLEKALEAAIRMIKERGTPFGDVGAVAELEARLGQDRLSDRMSLENKSGGTKP